jgi:hypothetical protein
VPDPRAFSRSHHRRQDEPRRVLSRRHPAPRSRSRASAWPRHRSAAALIRSEVALLRSRGWTDLSSTKFVEPNSREPTAVDDPEALVQLNAPKDPNYVSMSIAPSPANANEQENGSRLQHIPAISAPSARAGPSFSSPSRTARSTPPRRRTGPAAAGRHHQKRLHQVSLRGTHGQIASARARALAHAARTYPRGDPRLRRAREGRRTSACRASRSPGASTSSRLWTAFCVCRLLITMPARPTSFWRKSETRPFTGPRPAFGSARVPEAKRSSWLVVSGSSSAPRRRRCAGLGYRSCRDHAGVSLD